MNYEKVKKHQVRKIPSYLRVGQLGGCYFSAGFMDTLSVKPNGIEFEVCQESQQFRFRFVKDFSRKVKHGNFGIPAHAARAILRKVQGLSETVWQMASSYFKIILDADGWYYCEYVSSMVPNKAKLLEPTVWKPYDNNVIYESLGSEIELLKIQFKKRIELYEAAFAAEVEPIENIVGQVMRQIEPKLSGIIDNWSGDIADSKTLSQESYVVSLGNKEYDVFTSVFTQMGNVEVSLQVDLPKFGSVVTQYRDYPLKKSMNALFNESGTFTHGEKLAVRETSTISALVSIPLFN